MTPYTKTELEEKVKQLNNWLFENDEFHPEYKGQAHKRNYYVEKLVEMDEFDLEQIVI